MLELHLVKGTILISSLHQAFTLHPKVLFTQQLHMFNPGRYCICNSYEQRKDAAERNKIGRHLFLDAIDFSTCVTSVVWLGKQWFNSTSLSRNLVKLNRQHFPVKTKYLPLSATQSLKQHSLHKFLPYQRLDKHLKTIFNKSVKTELESTRYSHPKCFKFSC